MSQSNPPDSAVENALRHIATRLNRDGWTSIPVDDELPVDFWMFALWKNHHFQNDPMEWGEWQTLFEGYPETLIRWGDWGYEEWRGLAWEPSLELFVNNELVSQLAGLQLEPEWIGQTPPVG